MGRLRDLYQWAELNFYGLAVSGLFATDAGITVANMTSQGVNPVDLSHLVIDVVGVSLSTGMYSRQAQRFSRLTRRLTGENPDQITPEMYEGYLFAPCTRRSLRLALRENVDESIWKETFRPQYPVRCALKHFIPCYK